MPRRKKIGVSVPAALAAVSASLDQLMRAIAASVPAGVAGKGGKVLAVAAKGGKRGKNPLLSKKQRGVWAKYTPAQREARIRKMLAARGVKRKNPPKGK